MPSLGSSSVSEAAKLFRIPNAPRPKLKKRTCEGVHIDFDTKVGKLREKLNLPTTVIEGRISHRKEYIELVIESSTDVEQSARAFAELFLKRDPVYSNSDTGMAAVQLEAYLWEQDTKLYQRFVETQVQPGYDTFLAIFQGRLQEADLDRLTRATQLFTKLNLRVNGGDVAVGEDIVSDVCILEGKAVSQSEASPPDGGGLKAPTSPQPSLTQPTTPRYSTVESESQTPGLLPCLQEDYDNVWESGGLKTTTMKALFGNTCMNEAMRSGAVLTVTDHNGVAWSTQGDTWFPDVDSVPAVDLMSILPTEDGLTEAGMKVANTIKKQLGQKALYMMGAKNMSGDAKSLSFKIGRNKLNANYITITLNSMDTYDIEFIRAGVKGRKVKKAVKGVYVDQLHKIIQDATGMALSLTKHYEGMDEAKATPAQIKAAKAVIKLNLPRVLAKHGKDAKQFKAAVDKLRRYLKQGGMSGAAIDHTIQLMTMHWLGMEGGVEQVHKDAKATLALESINEAQKPSPQLKAAIRKGGRKEPRLHRQYLEKRGFDLGEIIKVGGKEFIVRKRIYHPYDYHVWLKAETLGTDLEMGTPLFILANKDISEAMIGVKVTTDKGTTWSTSIQGPFAKAKKYFMNKQFNVGQGGRDKMEKVVKVELVEAPSHKAFANFMQMPESLDEMEDFDAYYTKMKRQNPKLTKEAAQKMFKAMQRVKDEDLDEAKGNIGALVKYWKKELQGVEHPWTYLAAWAKKNPDKIEKDPKGWATWMYQEVFGEYPATAAARKRKTKLAASIEEAEGDEGITQALSKALSKQKSLMGAKSIKQNYKGTGKKKADRQLWIRFQNGATIDIWLYPTYVTYGGVVYLRGDGQRVKPDPVSRKIEGLNAARAALEIAQDLKAWSETTTESMDEVMRALRMGKGYVAHGVTPQWLGLTAKGKFSAWYDENKKLTDAEQILGAGRGRAVKKGGPVWKALQQRSGSILAGVKESVDSMSTENHYHKADGPLFSQYRTWALEENEEGTIIGVNKKQYKVPNSMDECVELLQEIRTVYHDLDAEYDMMVEAFLKEYTEENGEELCQANVLSEAIEEVLTEGEEQEFIKERDSEVSRNNKLRLLAEGITTTREPLDEGIETDQTMDELFAAGMFAKSGMTPTKRRRTRKPHKKITGEIGEDDVVEGELDDDKAKEVATALLSTRLGTRMVDLHYRAYMSAVIAEQSTAQLMKFKGAKEAKQALIDKVGKGIEEVANIKGKGRGRDKAAQIWNDLLTSDDSPLGAVYGKLLQLPGAEKPRSMGAPMSLTMKLGINAKAADVEKMFTSKGFKKKGGKLTHPKAYFDATVSGQLPHLTVHFTPADKNFVYSTKDKTWNVVESVDEAGYPIAHCADHTMDYESRRKAERDEALKNAPKKLAELKAARAMAQGLIKNVYDKVKRANKNEDKLVVLAKVKNAVTRMDMYAEFRKFAEDMGLVDPSTLGIWESEETLQESDEEDAKEWRELFDDWKDVFAAYKKRIAKMEKMGEDEERQTESVLLNEDVLPFICEGEGVTREQIKKQVMAAEAFEPWRAESAKKMKAFMAKQLVKIKEKFPEEEELLQLARVDRQVVGPLSLWTALDRYIADNNVVNLGTYGITALDTNKLTEGYEAARVDIVAKSTKAEKDLPAIKAARKVADGIIEAAFTQAKKLYPDASTAVLALQVRAAQDQLNMWTIFDSFCEGVAGITPSAAGVYLGESIDPFASAP